MRQILLLAIFLSGPLLMTAQETFSRKYDLDSLARRNNFLDFEVIGDEIFTYSTIFRPVDSSLFAPSVALTRIDLEGMILQQILLDSFNTIYCCSEGLGRGNNSIFMSSHKLNDSYDQLSLMRFNTALEQIDRFDFDKTDSALGVVNQGVTVIDSAIFLYGNSWYDYPISDSIRIIKMDFEGNKIFDKLYSYGYNSSVDIVDLQKTDDGNIAFIMNVRSAAGANTGFSGIRLVEVDYYGNFLDTISLNTGSVVPALQVSSEGGYVFSTEYQPFVGFDFQRNGTGSIAMVDQQMDTVEWFIELPSVPESDGIYYDIYEIIEADNGDLIACGDVNDKSDRNQPNSNYVKNGFIARLSSDGELKWLRVYKNDNDLLPHEDFGRFRPSLLSHIKELPSGQLLAGGMVYVEANQLTALNEEDTETIHLWLLLVDEDGCLDGHDCEEIQYITSSNEKFWSIENSVVIHPNPVQNLLKVESDKVWDNYAIYDSKGVMIHTGRYADKINVSHLNAGLYFIEIYKREGTIYSSKFLKL